MMSRLQRIENADTIRNPESANLQELTRREKSQLVCRLDWTESQRGLLPIHGIVRLLLYAERRL